MGESPEPRLGDAPRGRGRWLALPVVVLLAVLTTVALLRHQGRRHEPSSDPLAPLGDPLVRAWLHAYQADAHELELLQAQPPGTPTRPGESLADEQASLVTTWTGLARAWLAAGGQLRDCPGVEARSAHEQARVLALQQAAGDRVPAPAGAP